MTLKPHAPPPIARYLTHPQVEIDAARDVQRWHLNAQGRERVEALVRRVALKGTTRIISSPETKALETAEPLAKALGITVELHPDMCENDRSATGFLPPEEFERVADQFFSDPAKSIRGWETALAAQNRIVAAVSACLDTHSDGDVLFVGHGAVGTLLWCALSGNPISRQYDQGPGDGGNWFSFELGQRKPLGHWQPMEHLK